MSANARSEMDGGFLKEDSLTINTADWLGIRTIDPRSFVPEFFSFHCGNNGEVKISLRDGSVTIENCTLPEAAQEFWRAVTNAFPSVAQGILGHARPTSKCPECSAPEVEAETPQTKYACGSSDYDQRPGTFQQSDRCKGNNS